MLRRGILTGVCAIAVAGFAGCEADREDEVAPPAAEQPMSAPGSTPAAETPTTGPGMAPPTAGETSPRGIPGSATDTATLQGTEGTAAPIGGTNY